VVLIIFFGVTNADLDALFYDVYTRLAELHLADIGADVEWSDIEVVDSEDRWGESRQYFRLPLYRLPIGKMGVAS
jgi:protein arginine N-methyltransferase 2